MNKFGFDNYSFKARLQPALLVLFPILLAAPIWAPDVYKFGVALIGMIATCGILYVLSNLSRSFGLKAQGKLMSEWGGMPTTLALRHLDQTFDSSTTRRYHDFLEKRVPGWIAPRERDEKKDIQKADAKYTSAVKWLREFTRDKDKYPLVLKENIEYGFRRNTFGMKPLGIAVCLISISLSGFSLWGDDLSELFNAHLLKSIYTTIISLLLFWWVFCVTNRWVKGAALSYTRALLAACDITNARG